MPDAPIPMPGPRALTTARRLSRLVPSKLFATYRTRLISVLSVRRSV
jgi:hypothetical protein